MVTELAIAWNRSSHCFERASSTPMLTTGPHHERLSSLASDSRQSLENSIQNLVSLLPRDGKTGVDLQDLCRYSIDSAADFLSDNQSTL